MKTERKPDKRTAKRPLVGIASRAFFHEPEPFDFARTKARYGVAFDPRLVDLIESFAARAAEDQSWRHRLMELRKRVQRGEELQPGEVQERDFLEIHADAEKKAESTIMHVARLAALSLDAEAFVLIADVIRAVKAGPIAASSWSGEGIARAYRTTLALKCSWGIESSNWKVIYRTQPNAALTDLENVPQSQWRWKHGPPTPKEVSEIYRIQFPEHITRHRCGQKKAQYRTGSTKALMAEVRRWMAANGCLKYDKGQWPAPPSLP